MVMAKDRLDVLGRILIIYQLNYLKALNNRAIYKQCSLSIHVYICGSTCNCFSFRCIFVLAIIFFFYKINLLYSPTFYDFLFQQPFMIFLLVMFGEKKLNFVFSSNSYFEENQKQNYRSMKIIRRSYIYLLFIVLRLRKNFMKIE